MGAHKVVVRLPERQFSLEESLEIVASVIGKGGCNTCFSGRDIYFVNEVELVVDEGGGVQEVGGFAED